MSKHKYRCQKCGVHYKSKTKAEKCCKLKPWQSNQAQPPRQK